MVRNVREPQTLMATMDLIKSWMPTLNPPSLQHQRPTHHHDATSDPALTTTTSSNTSLGHNLRLESCRLLSRISCHFFSDRSGATAATIASAPARQTIQTDYISTISSLVDRTRSYDPASPSGTAVPTHRVHDAQSENFGLYALKCNRSGRGRGMLGAPPPVPQRRRRHPMAPMLRDDSAADDVDDVLVGEHIIIRPARPPVRPPVPIAQASVVSHQHKPRAPPPQVPRILISNTSPDDADDAESMLRTLIAESRRNRHSVLELDTVFLEPLLIETVQPLPAVAELPPCSALPTASCQPLLSRIVATPPTVVETAARVQAPPFSQGVSIFAGRRRSQAFDNFTDELSGEPVCVAGDSGHHRQHMSRSNSSAEYVRCFARAFSAAFSEEDGVHDVDVVVGADGRPDNDGGHLAAVNEVGGRSDNDHGDDGAACYAADAAAVATATSIEQHKQQQQQQQQHEQQKPMSRPSPTGGHKSINVADGSDGRDGDRGRQCDLIKITAETWCGSMVPPETYDNSALPVMLGWPDEEPQQQPQAVQPYTTCSPILEVPDDDAYASSEELGSSHDDDDADVDDTINNNIPSSSNDISDADDANDADDGNSIIIESGACQVQRHHVVATTTAASRWSSVEHDGNDNGNYCGGGGVTQTGGGAEMTTPTPAVVRRTVYIVDL